MSALGNALFLFVLGLVSQSYGSRDLCGAFLFYKTRKWLSEMTASYSLVMEMICMWFLIL